MPPQDKAAGGGDQSREQPGRLNWLLPRKPGPAWHTCTGNNCGPGGARAPPVRPSCWGYCRIVLGEAGVSELIRFLRFQCSPNPVSPAVIVTTQRFQLWQAVEDRRCGDSTRPQPPALTSRLGTGDSLPRSPGWRPE